MAFICYYNLANCFISLGCFLLQVQTDGGLDFYFNPQLLLRSNVYEEIGIGKKVTRFKILLHHLYLQQHKD